MSYRLPEKVRTLTPYAPISGEFRIRLDANESCFTLPKELRAQVRDRLEGLPLNRYPDAAAREVCALAARRFGVKPEEIVAGNGSDELIFLLQSCLMEKGMTLGTFACDFSMYAFYSALCEVRHVELSKRDDLTVDVDAAIEAVNREGIDVLLFSNPCNPTSLLLERDAVERLVRSVGALVVVDEAYMEFAEGSVIGLIEKYDNLLVLKTCSKAVGLAGIRLGFALGNRTLIDALKSAKSPYNINALTQETACAVLGAPHYVDGCARRLSAWTAELHGGLTRLAETFPAQIEKIYPTRTNFVFLRLADADGVFGALGRRGIAVRRMGAHLRISCGTQEENSALLKALREVLEQAAR